MGITATRSTASQKDISPVPRLANSAPRSYVARTATVTQRRVMITAHTANFSIHCLTTRTGPPIAMSVERTEKKTTHPR
jgi:hypothetical protein